VFLRERVVPYIGERWSVAPPHIGLLGISMGGQGALQLAYRYGREYPVVAAISPAVDFHNWHGRGLPLDEMFASKEAARQATATLQLHPLNWPRHQLLVCDPADADWFEGVERLASKLYSSGIPFERDFETTAGGHSWDYFNQMAATAVGFLAEHLEA
jgi:S-formylglutathione hydrolase FrmB